MADSPWTLTDIHHLPGAGSAFARPGHLLSAAREASWSGARSKRATDHLAGDLKAAERQLGMLLRRMRAYRRAPYDFASSRISDDADFERCLDLATAVSLRIAELTGAPVASPRERERVREQVLHSVSAGAAGLDGVR